MMKQSIGFVLVISAFIACRKNADQTGAAQLKLAQKACGSDMVWLQRMITKGEEDKTTKKYLGSYIGTIYLTKYQGTPVFMVTMMLNSGGLLYHTFDCDSQRVTIPDMNFYADTKARGAVVYSNSPYR